MRTEQTIFDDLARLCLSKGFIHALSSLFARDNIVTVKDQLTAEDSASMSSPERLIRTESATLIGLMMRAPIDFSLPPPQVVSSYFERSQELLQELHHAMVPPNIPAVLKKAAQEPAFNPFTSGDFLREPIFYAAESAYPFQYRDLAPRKYAADSQWLLDHKQVDLDVGHAVCRALPGLLNQRYFSVLQALQSKPVEQWTLLPGFVFSSARVASHIGRPASKVQAFIEAFTLPPGERNEEFTSLNSFNAAYAYPFIRRGPNEFVLLQYQGAMAAFYETPFYWMCEDENYGDAASSHRGEFAEAFSAERLARVFGREHVFQNVELRRSRKETLGEIDVLVTFGDRLMVVQAKSKRLTLKARAGEDRELRNDFKQAVQDAVDQSFSCASLLLDPSVSLHSKEGSPVQLASRPKTIFPITLLSDDYPGLSFQSHQLLQAATTDEIRPPIVTDVFALDVITEMLDSPLRFLSYLSLRARFGDRFLASNEIVLLALHLKQNLWLESDIDLMSLADDIALPLDAAMTCRRDGLPGALTPDGILTRFRGTHFSRTVEQLEDEPAPAALDLGLLLLELSESTVVKLNDGIDRIMTLAAADGQPHRCTVLLQGCNTGLTLHVGRQGGQEAKALLLKDCDRYADKADRWFGITLDVQGSIRFVVEYLGSQERD